MNEVRTTLREVLRDGGVLTLSGGLYLPFDQKWTLATPCVVSPVPEDDGLPGLAKECGFEYALLMSAVIDIVENAKMQKRRIGEEELLEAFLYYYDHDAFLVWP